ncbi:MAG TPA: hypothetical protein VLS92_02435 [Acidimicrobiia bacterium]|nr:hypothetical protein [Acidimicrobiia bacterium]
MSRRVVGWIVAGVGLVVVFISAAADVIGISSGGSAEMFGNRQIIGTVIGAVVVAAGLAVSYLPARRSARRRTAAERPPQPIKHRRKR